MATAPIQILARAEQPRPEEVPSGRLIVRAVLTNVIQVEATVVEHPKRLTEILLGTVGENEFRVIKPIPVRFHTEGNVVVASWHDIDEFGTGASMSLACEELGHTVSELYRSLQADQGRLGPDLQRVWAILQEHLIRRR